MHPVLVTPPAELPISAQDAIARVPSLADVDNTVVTALIEAATSYLDGWSGILGRCLVEQTWRVRRYSHEDGRYWLPFPDVLSLVSVKDQDGFDVLNDFALQEDRHGCGWYVSTVNDQARSKLTIEFTAGYGSAEKVPSAIKQAIVMMAAGMYVGTEANGGLRSEQIDGVSSVSFNSPEMIASVRDRTVGMLLSPFRRFGV